MNEWDNEKNMQETINKKKIKLSGYNCDVYDDDDDENISFFG